MILYNNYVGLLNLNWCLLMNHMRNSVGWKKDPKCLPNETSHSDYSRGWKAAFFSRLIIGYCRSKFESALNIFTITNSKSNHLILFFVTINPYLRNSLFNYWYHEIFSSTSELLLFIIDTTKLGYIKCTINALLVCTFVLGIVNIRPHNYDAVTNRSRYCLSELFFDSWWSWQNAKAFSDGGIDKTFMLCVIN